ncbi:MAG: hypothetical protein EXR79_15795 [Myxococcales bacterium]|nr:hypothetical protein [Myxococcales bacterium]
MRGQLGHPPAITARAQAAFSPADLTIQAGDSVEFSPASVHNVVEVSPATWTADGNAPVAGGFLVGFGEVTVAP